MALIDTGAQGSIFIDSDRAQQVCNGLEISPMKLLKPKLVRGFNSTKPDKISHAIYLTMTLENHTQALTPMMMTKMT